MGRTYKDYLREERNYSDIMSIVKKKKEKNKDFYTTDEYKKLYDEATKAYKKEGLDVKRKNELKNRRKFNKQIRQGMEDTGMPVGLFLGR